MPDKRTWAAAAALLALTLCLAVAAASSPALAQAPTRGQLRIQLGYYNGTYWMPWNSTMLNLYGTQWTFTVELYKEESNAGELLARFEGVPDANGNLTLTGIDPTKIIKDQCYNITIKWNWKLSDGRVLSFRVFNGTLYARSFDGERQLVFEWPWQMKDKWANNSRFQLAAVALTVQARDSIGVEDLGPYPLGGARIVVINGTNWDRKRWADGSTPAVLYNIVTPESGPYAGRASFIVPNTTDARYLPEKDKTYNYTVGLRVFWNNMMVYNLTFAQSSHNTKWVEAHVTYRNIYGIYGWTGLTYFSPFNFTGFSRCVAIKKRPVWLNCSVYLYKLRLLDASTPGQPLASTSDVEIVASMSVTNATVGNVVIARPRATDAQGRVDLRYAALCINEEEGVVEEKWPSTPANLTVYWKSTKLGVQYLILNLTLRYGTYSYGRWTVRDVAPHGNGISITPAELHAYANVTRIQLVDRSDPTYPAPLFENTKVYLTFPGALEQIVGVNASGIIDLSFCNYVLPLMDGMKKLDNYRIKVLYKNVKVLDTSFDPNVFASGYPRYVGAFSRFACDVYLAEFHVLDAHRLHLMNMSQLRLRHPTGEVFDIYVPSGGVVTDRVPGGVGYSVEWICYKSGDLLTPLEGGSFNVTANTVVNVVAPVYDVYVKVTNWERTWWVEGLKVGFSWSFPTAWTQWGNMTSAVVSQSRAIEPPRYIRLAQVPRGAHTLLIYVSTTPGLENYVGSKVGEYAINVVDSDVYDNKVRSWIYDRVTFTIKTADGSPLPEYTTVANTTLLVTVFNMSATSPITYNSTNGRSSVTLFSNITQKRVFVGGAKYNFTLYAGGVTVYGPTLTLPIGTDEVEVTSSIYAMKFITKDYYEAFGIPNLRVSVSWTGLNYTYYRTEVNQLANYRWINTTVWNNWETYFRNVESCYVSSATRSFMLYNASALTDSSGEAVFYIPIWHYSKQPVAYHTPIEFNVTTVPGTTPSVPSGLTSVSVMDRHTQAPIYRSPWFFNVTKDVGFIEGRTQKTLNVYAAKFTVALVNEKAEPIAGYRVNVTIEPPADLSTIPRRRLIAYGYTDPAGKVTFSSSPTTLFWCNYSYGLFIYKEAEAKDLVDQDGKPISFTYNIVGNYSLADSWAPGVTKSVRFEGTIAVTALDAYSQPLASQIVVLKAGSGPATGQVVSYSITGADGKAFFYLPLEGTNWVYAYYSAAEDAWKLAKAADFYVEVYWTRAEGGKYKVFWPILIYGPSGRVAPDASLTASCSVFYAKLRFISDTGRALEWGAIKVPSGPDVGIPFKVVYYLGGVERSDVYAYEGVTMANATFNLVRCPVGDYKVVAWWPNFRDIKIFDSMLSITTNLPGPGVREPVQDLKTLVYDITLNLKTPRGTVCGNATAYIKLPQGVSITEVTDSEGNIKLINIPSSVSTASGKKYPLRVEKTTWRGYDALRVPVEKEITSTTTYYIVADNIVALNVRVLGARGQGLPYASVYAEPVLTVVADESGFVSVELPRRVYTVTATYKGKTASIKADVTDPAKFVFDATVTLDVYIELFGYAMSAGEFALSIVLGIIVVFIVAFIVHEYIVWRRKRIAAAVVKA